MKSLYRRVVKLGTAYSIGNVANNAITFFLLPVYTSYLAPADYGVIAFMAVTIQMLTRAIGYPLTDGLVRFYYSPDYAGRQGALLSNLIMLAAAMTGVLGAGYWAARHWLCAVLFQGQGHIGVVNGYLLVLLLTPLSEIALQLLRLLTMANYYVATTLTRSLGSCALALYLMVVKGMGVMAVVYGQVFGVVLVHLMCAPVVLRHCTWRFQPRLLIPPLKYGGPQVVTGYAGLIVRAGDRFIVRFYGTMDMLGVYSFGYTIGSFMNTLIVEPLRQSLRPLLLQMEDRPDEQKKFIRQAAVYYFVFAIFVALGMSVFSKDIIMVMARNEAFWSGWVIVPIVALSYAISGLSDFLRWGLVMKCKTFHISGVVLFAALVNVGLNFVFIPWWGMMGAALATLVSYLVWNALYRYFSARMYGLRFELARLIHVLAVGLALYFVSVYLADTSSLLLNICAKSAILLAYPGVLLMTGFATPREKEMLGRLQRDLRSNGLRGILGRLKGA